MVAASTTASTVTTTGGVSGYVPKFTGAATVADGLIYSGSSAVGINTASPAATLEVNGSAQFDGTAVVANSGNATSSTGYPSYGLDFNASGYSSTSKSSVKPQFILRAEPTGNNTASPSATLNMLYSSQGTTAETGFYINSNGTVHFSPSQSFPGNVSSVGLTAPASDFTVTGSPLKGAGTLALQWTTPPTSAKQSNAIIKRDANGGFQAGAVNATALVDAGNLTVTGTSSLGATNLSGPIGIGTNSPAPGTLLNLNKNNTASADFLLLDNNSTKGVQLRDSGSGVDLESIGVPLYVNFGTKQPTVINPNGGTVFIGDNNPGDYSSSTSFPLFVGSSPTKYSANFEGYVIFGSDAVIEGNLEIYDNLEVVGTKDFRIDHPLDPTQKYLRHAAIESSEVLNQYSGNITTDEIGQAMVQLPDWFEVENTDFRYQLTVIGGQFAQAMVAKKVAHNQFTIATNAPHVEVSWQVTAKRNDAYMKAHPFVVEQQKPESKRGHYDHPELYGQAVEARR